MAHILVVDDDRDLCNLLRTALERDGHTVTALYRGDAVTEQHCRWADCILLDVMMPGEDGFAVCRRLRALADCPILFLTARTDETDVLRGLGLGGDDYLPKPFRLAELRARINAHLRRQNRAPVHRVLRGGVLRSRKSIAAPGLSIDSPTLTAEDLENLRAAPECGVTGVMLPFVRGAGDLCTLRRALRETGGERIRIFAKIENLAGVNALPEFLPLADQIVIARGDLGNAMPLWELPACQKKLAAACRAAHVPFMVVTQLLDSMCERAVPTRAEVLDIYNAVLDGASSLMLTGETAAGHYPARAMEYLVRTARTAL